VAQQVISSWIDGRKPDRGIGTDLSLLSNEPTSVGVDPHSQQQIFHELSERCDYTVSNRGEVVKPDNDFVDGDHSAPVVSRLKNGNVCPLLLAEFCECTNGHQEAKR